MCRILLASAVLFVTAAAAPAQGDKAKVNEIPKDVLAVLEKAEKFELFALDPEVAKGKGKEDKEKHDVFHGWRIVGKPLEVKNAETRTKLLSELKKAVANNKGEFALCFNPRHGIRATLGGKSVDLVICFECLRARAIADGKSTEFLITNAPQADFDSVLMEGKILPKD